MSVDATDAVDRRLDVRRDMRLSLLAEVVEDVRFPRIRDCRRSEDRAISTCPCRMMKKKSFSWGAGDHSARSVACDERVVGIYSSLEVTSRCNFYIPLDTQNINDH